MERWRTRLGLTAALSLFGGVVVACGSDEGTDTITAERFPSAYAQALCGSLQHCCDENQVAENFASCTSGWKSYVEKLLGATAALTNYEPRTAKACVDAIRAAGSVSCQPIPGSISDARATCAQIFVGKKPIGAACSTAAECAPDPGGKAVVCAVPPEKLDAGVLPLSVRPFAITAPVCTLSGAASVPGGPCLVDAANVRSNCDPASYCEPKTQKCTPLGVVGADCIPGSCAPGGVCATSGTNAGKCVPASPLGGPCSAPNECDPTSRCDIGTKTCVQKKESGQPCTDDSECNVGTCDVGTKKCLKNSIATTNTCNGKP